MQLMGVSYVNISTRQEQLYKKASRIQLKEAK